MSDIQFNLPHIVHLNLIRTMKQILKEVELASYTNEQDFVDSKCVCQIL